MMQVFNVMDQEMKNKAQAFAFMELFHMNVRSKNTRFAIRTCMDVLTIKSKRKLQFA
jgi:hypothetical protein